MRRLLLLVGAIVFLDTMFFAVVAPLLPHYEDELGLSKTSAGILLAAYPAGTLAAALPSGVLAARIGARPTVVLGLALLAGSSIAFALADDVLLLDAARLVQGLGGACSWAGGMAWLLVQAPPQRRGQVIGAALSAAIAGSLFGPVLGAIALGIGAGPVFAAVAVLAVALAAWSLATPAPQGRSEGAHPPVSRALRSPRVRLAMWLVALPALGFGALDTLVPLRMDDAGASGTAVAAAFLVAAAVEGVISPLVGRLSDRRGRLLPIRAGLLAAVGLLLLVPLPHHAVLIACTLVGTAAALGVFWAPAMALLSDAAEGIGVHQGVAFGLTNLAWAGGMVVGAAAGGGLADATSDLVPCLVLSALCGATLAGLVLPGRQVLLGDVLDRAVRGPGPG